MRLDLEDLGDVVLIPSLTLPCRLYSLEFLNEEFWRVFLRLPPNSNFEFVAGQYINIIKGDIRRSYSIANASRQDGGLEPHIKKVKDDVSDYVFDDAAVYDLLRFEAPLGTFSFGDDSSEKFVLMARGTEIETIKALLETFESQRINKKVFVSLN